MAKEKSNKHKTLLTGKRFRSLLSANSRLLLDVSADIRAAHQFHDREYVRYGLSLFHDAIQEGTVLVREFYSRQATFKIGAEDKGRHWQDGSPSEIIDTMYVIVSHYLSLIKSLETAAAAIEDEGEARVFDRQRIQYLREMALRVQIGKKVILKKDSTFWTPQMEADFKEMLEYRLDK